VSRRVQPAIYRGSIPQPRVAEGGRGREGGTPQHDDGGAGKNEEQHPHVLRELIVSRECRSEKRNECEQTQRYGLRCVCHF
jgi:hypothetical protein